MIGCRLLPTCACTKQHGDVRGSLGKAGIVALESLYADDKAPSLLVEGAQKLLEACLVDVAEIRCDRRLLVGELRSCVNGVIC